MLKRGSSLIKRVISFVTNKQTILYIIFGLLATVVNWAVYIPLCPILGSAALSDIISTTLAILFAYLTNKTFVFGSRSWSVKVVFPEITKFFSSRLFAFLVELAIVGLMADILGLNENIWKLIASVFTMILNYICTRYIFRNNKNKD